MALKFILSVLCGDKLWLGNTVYASGLNILRFHLLQLVLKLFNVLSQYFGWLYVGFLQCIYFVDVSWYIDNIFCAILRNVQICNLYIFISVFYWCILMLMYFWHNFYCKALSGWPWFWALNKSCLLLLSDKCKSTVAIPNKFPF